MKKTIRILTFTLAALLVMVLLGGCSKEAIQGFQDGFKQGVKDGIQENLANAANADPATIEEMQGSVSGQTYTNTAAGFSISFPDGYSLRGHDDLTGNLMDKTDKIKAQITDPKAAEIIISQEVPRCLAYNKKDAVNGNTPFFLIYVANMQKPLKQDIVSFATNAVKKIALSDETYNYTSPVAAKVGGMDVAYYEASKKNGSDGYLERLYVFYTGNYYVNIHYISHADPDNSDLKKVIDSVHIDK